MPKPTTTTDRPRQGPPPPTLSNAQRWALALAEQQGWGVAVEARDGSRLQLRQGLPARALVLYLPSSGLPLVSEEHTT